MPKTIKKLMFGFFFLAVSFMFTAEGVCFNEYGRQDSIIGGKENNQGTYMEADQMMKKEVPFNQLSSEASFVSQIKISEGTKETVAGLKSAGFSVDDIVTTLKNGNKSAAEISIACLNANISGNEIFSALINAGFSQESAEAVVRAVLRNEKQLYGNQQGNQEDAQGLVGITSFTADISKTNSKDEATLKSLVANEYQLKNTIVALKQANVSTPQLIEVLKDMGVSAENIIAALGGDIQQAAGGVFNGLGEWNKFQDGRFSKAELANARHVELVASLLACGYSVDETVKGFMDLAKDKNDVQKGKIIRSMIADLGNAGVDFEKTIGALKNNGVSFETIADALTGKSVSLVDKVKSGMFFNKEKKEIADKIINGVYKGEKLAVITQALQKEGHSITDIADTLGYLKVSSAQVSGVLNNQNVNLKQGV